MVPLVARRRIVGGLLAAPALPALAADTVKLEGLRGEGKPTTFFSDFERTPTGLQYKEFKAGAGPLPRQGDKVVVDWTGVTVGYQGRFFQTRNKPQGGAFADDGYLADYLIWRVGDGSVIPGIDEAVRSMQPGAIRRVLVPVELGYPEDGFARIGPKPSTFSGERALDFVLSSKAMMDKTLMFDLKLVSVNGPSG